MSGAELIINGLTILLIITGSFFFTAGTLGLLRFPDFYSRTHAGTKCDTIGVGSVLLGLAVRMGLHPDSLKIMIIAALVLVSSPTMGHALARAAYRTGLKPWRRRLRKGSERT